VRILLTQTADSRYAVKEENVPSFTLGFGFGHALMDTYRFNRSQLVLGDPTVVKYGTLIVSEWNEDWSLRILSDSPVSYLKIVQLPVAYIMR
jgi:hypothetical protein